ncbi:MAG: carbohydrate ABC transporter substrate-binding protein [Lachnospiraceae bacterium]|jgi:hypothetical protein|nr:carbohydrate ABC transporter substrate-binding protein [Lachnospiraceae bacterium]
MKKRKSVLSPRAKSQAPCLRRGIWRRIAIWALALTLAACSPPQQESPNQTAAPQAKADENSTPPQAKADEDSAPPQAKGRYREEGMGFPVPISHIYDISCKEGRVGILSEGIPGTFFYCESADAGVSWQQKEMQPGLLPEGYRVVSACLGAGGEIYVSAGKMSENPIEERRAVGEYSYFKLEETEGGFLASPLSLETPAVEEGYEEYGLRSLAASEDGKLYGLWSKRKGEESEYGVYCFDLDAGGKAAWSKETRVANIALAGETLYLDEHEGMVQGLEASSGEKEKEIPMRSADFFCMDSLAGQKLFYCNGTGIYGADGDMAYTELLVDGALSSFSDISYSIQDFCCVSEQVFLVFLEDGEGKIQGLRYEYDPKLPTRPEQELVVYSLDSNDIVKKLVADFQASHPDVYVKYEVARQEEGMEDADAINVLNTEILAGDGPDVLILDGLPWEAYGEKGILEDFSQELEGSLREGEVFCSVFEALQTEGAQYAVPLSFSIPVVIGEKEQIAKIGSWEELGEAVGKAAGESPLAIWGFWPFAISISWQGICQEDGSLSKEALERFLEAGKRICDGVKEKTGDVMYFFDEMGNWEDGEGKVHPGDAFIAAPVWDLVYGNAEFGLGYLGDMRDFTAISDHMPGQDLGYRVIGEGSFCALAAGVNSKSRQAGLGKEFLMFAVSEAEQRALNEQLPGVELQFPVNRAVWEEAITKPSGDKMEAYEDIFGKLGGTFAWPEKEAFEDLEEEIAGLKYPALEERVVLDAVLEGAEAYFSGEKGVEDAVGNIMQKLELYLAE